MEPLTVEIALLLSVRISLLPSAVGISLLVHVGAALLLIHVGVPLLLIHVGISLLLLGFVQMVPAVQSSFLLMGSPVGLFLQAGKFLQQDFLFSILPHFEGIMLLIWCGIAAVLGVVGFMRFRKASL